MRPLRFFVIMSAVVILSGCSFKLIYGQLDWLVPWYADDYVSFNPAQEIILDDQLEQFLSWHRQDQLPQYADYFDSIAQAMTDGLDGAELEQIEGQARQFSEQLLRQFIPHLNDLLIELDDAQVEELFANLERRNKDYHERYIETSDKKQRRERNNSMKKFIQRWTGELNENQSNRVKQWSLEYRRLGSEFLQSRVDWQEKFKVLLERRGEGGGIETQLQSLLLQPLEPRLGIAQADFEENRRLIRKLYLEIDQMLTDQQRSRALRRLRGYAEDFRELAESTRAAS